MKVYACNHTKFTFAQRATPYNLQFNSYCSSMQQWRRDSDDDDSGTFEKSHSPSQLRRSRGKYCRIFQPNELSHRQGNYRYRQVSLNFLCIVDLTQDCPPKHGYQQILCHWLHTHPASVCRRYFFFFFCIYYCR